MNSQLPKHGGVFLEHINTTKKINESNSCLEFLLLSFVHSLEVSTKQAAGLLTQGYKYLAHIVAKGLKGEFAPIINWYQNLYSDTDRLAVLVQNEQENNSLRFVLEAVKPGLLSKSL